MALGKRPEGRQEELFVATSDIRRLSHPFYRTLERLLRAEGFDAFAEEGCRAFYAPQCPGTATILSSWLITIRILFRFDRPGPLCIPLPAS